MDDLERIEQRYGFRLPEAYFSMQALGWFDRESPDPVYFWLYEARWMSPSEIADYEPAKYHKPEYAPFARSARGDHWCWWPSEHPEAVVLCPHDCEEGEFYAPSFTGFIHRSLLDFAKDVSIEYQDEDEIRRNLREAATRLSSYFPLVWQETIKTLAEAPLAHRNYNEQDQGQTLLTWEQYQEIVQRDLAFPLLDQRFQWMYPLSEDEAETAAIWREIILESGPDVPIEEKIARVKAEQARRKSEA